MKWRGFPWRTEISLLGSTERCCCMGSISAESLCQVCPSFYVTEIIWWSVPSQILFCCCLWFFNTENSLLRLCTSATHTAGVYSTVSMECLNRFFPWLKYEATSSPCSIDAFWEGISLCFSFNACFQILFKDFICVSSICICTSSNSFSLNVKCCFLHIQNVFLLEQQQLYWGCLLFSFPSGWRGSRWWCGAEERFDLDALDTFEDADKALLCSLTIEKLSIGMILPSAVETWGSTRR